MDLTEPLYAALKDSEYLLDVDTQKEFDKYRPHILDGFDHNMSYREVLVYNKLGKYLSSGRKLNVLDVGSGKLLTAKKLIQNTSFVETYTAIDKNVDANEHGNVIKRFVTNFEYRKLDILDEDFSTDTKYDIVMIDVEPHGKEIEVYERVKHALSESHLCILKHVGFIDLYGSCLADRFLQKYEDVVSDYYGECPRTIISTLHEIRDIFIVFTPFKTTKIRNMLTCDPPHSYSNPDLKQFCRCTRPPCN